MLKSKGRSKAWMAGAGLSMFVLLAVFVAAAPLVFSAAGPTITDLQPADGSFINYNSPTISANYSSDPAEINESSVKMGVDGNDVAPDSISATGVSYTPTEPLGEGLHNVTVNVSDTADNSNSTSWLFTVDTILPMLLFTEPTPANESTNTTGYVNVTVNVTDPVPGSGLVDSVNVSIWNETGLYLDNTTFAFDGYKYYYWDNTSGIPLPGIPLPNGNYTYKVYAKDVAGNMNGSETRGITVTVTAISGDITGDGKVDWDDFLLFADAYDTVSGDPNYNVLADIHPETPDGDVDWDDFLLFADWYGYGT